MNESPLQKLLRLRKEKEQANANSASVNVEQETPALETVSRPSSSLEEPSGTEGPGVGSGEGGTILSSEGIRETGDSGIVDPVIEPDPEPTLVPEVIPEPQAKPMSAMDRLRALKSGGVKKDAGSSTDSSSSGNTDPVSLPEPKEVTPPKPRKTHPIAMEMAELEAALDAQVPGFVSILSTIHKKLKADPDVVTLLDDEEIGRIVAGLEKHTNVTIVAPRDRKSVV